ncbi:MAM and LDL-receptor class a domain-containing protein 1-like [Plakobranchus ocellatus]|uniref:MAM and LDL-receptor class a domain-containing protein 1-like n=1 Tax=Plakobranchus ocellatus TaxID=259542 RepID=A0AAV3YRQ8_9GAST|nr:MAM and LDL-receptor class a domain-containing protein 1-like [Plakobranchus ocellatus]
MYIEASNKVQGSNAVLVAGPVTVGPTDLCLEFWYHMYGKDQGVLSAGLRTRGQANDVKWFKKGNQGSDWYRGQFDIPSNLGVVDILFTAMVGNNYQSDTAIDDIILKNGSCGIDYGYCDFQLDLCSWSNSKDADMDWVFGKGKTVSADTGPNNDHTLKNASGQYIYIETSRPSVSGDTARLMSELFPPRNSVCFHFFYNMYGAGVGALRVSLVSLNSSTDSLAPIGPPQVLWTLTGNQGQGWQEGRVPIPTQYFSHRVLVEGVKGTSYTGDIGLDDLSFTKGDNQPCVVSPASAQPQVTTTPGAPMSTPLPTVPATFNCAFESSYCGWTNDKTAAKQWARYRGATFSQSTGPKADHTSGNGFYIYLEASSGRLNDSARLLSPNIQPGDQCLTFWYHMYGTSVNALSVQLWDAPVVPGVQSDKKVTIWEMRGSHGDKWLQASVDLGGPSNRFARQVVIEAFRGSTYSGDIAVDDIKLTQGACANFGTSTIDCDFENADICGYMQENSDAIDWTWASGVTSSSNTGPTTDHTYRTPSGNYKPASLI